MFASFDSVNTPGVKIWDFSRIPTGAPRIALEDDCAPFQLFATGGLVTVYVTLPTGAPAGKVVTIRNEQTGTWQRNVVVFDPASMVSQGASLPGNAYSIGPGQCLSFVCAPSFFGSATSQGLQAQWLPLQHGSLGAVASQGAVLSGNSNSATFSLGVVAGGYNNSASSYAAVCGGSGNNASSSYSFVGGGTTNVASGSYAFVGGGKSNQATGVNSTIPGGTQGSTRSVTGQFSIPACNVPLGLTYGASQTSSLIVAAQTTDATATRLRSDTSAAGTTNQLVLTASSAFHVAGTIIAAVTAGGDTSAWKFEAVIKRNSLASSTALVAAVVPTLIAQDTGAATWAVAVTADTTNGALAVTVTGAAATTIRWVCKLETTEVTY